MAWSAYRRRNWRICLMGSTGGTLATLGGRLVPDKIARLHFPGVSGSVARLFGTPVAETILASVHVRAHQ
jgi:hypothetical protein